MAAVPRRCRDAPTRRRTRRARRRSAELLERLLEEVLREQAARSPAAELHAARRGRGGAGTSAPAALAARGAAAQLAPLADARVHDAARARRTSSTSSGALAPGAGTIRRGPAARRRCARRARSKRAAAADPVDVRLVLTAHPTDMARRSVLTKQRAVGDALERLARPASSATRERTRARGRHPRGARDLVGHDELRAMRPRVATRCAASCGSSRTALYDAAGELALRATRALVGEDEAVGNRRCASASWAGADMDGNPNVSAQTILETLRAHRVLALRLLRDRVQAAPRGVLAGGDVCWTRAPSCASRSLRDERELPRTVAYLAERYPHEAGRAAASQARLRRRAPRATPWPRRAGSSRAEPGYGGPDELIADSRPSARASARRSSRAGGSTG